MLYFGDSRISSVFHQKSESLDPCLRRDEDGEFVMIGRLKGILIHKAPPWLVVDVQGVGYELEAPMSTFYDLPEVGREVFLFTHYAQKEDSVSLYGFLRESERRLFRDVQKVSGIGAKIALAVLSGVSVDEFARLLQASDVSALTRIPGIGKKTAERMVVELRDRAAGMATGLPSGWRRCRTIRCPRPSPPCSSWATSRPKPTAWPARPPRTATMPPPSSARRYSPRCAEPA
jgi:Holliday junction DNA helicase RuvA